jgi:hypothetical protein
MDIASSIAQTIVLFKHNGQICFEPASGEVGDRRKSSPNGCQRGPSCSVVGTLSTSMDAEGVDTGSI